MEPLFVFIGETSLKEEDKGSALLLADLDNGDEAGVFVRIRSWDPNKKHLEAQKLLGKKIRVEIFVEEE